MHEYLLCMEEEDCHFLSCTQEAENTVRKCELLPPRPAAARPV